MRLATQWLLALNKNLMSWKNYCSTAEFLDYFKYLLFNIIRIDRLAFN